MEIAASATGGFVRRRFPDRTDFGVARGRVSWGKQPCRLVTAIRNYVAFADAARRRTRTPQAALTLPVRLSSVVSERAHESRVEFGKPISEEIWPRDERMALSGCVGSDIGE